MPSRRASTGIDARGDARGFGLIELIVSLTVFSVLIGGVMVSLGAGLALTRSNRSRTVAANLASKEIDAVRETTFTDLSIGSTTSSVSVDGVAYSVTRNLEWVNSTATAGQCDSTSTSPQVVRVSVGVSWTNMKAVQPVRQSTVLAPPVGSYDPNTGHIAVRVRNRDASPIGAVPVRVVGTGVDETITTTDAAAASAGCAFFGFLPAGSYTVSLGTSGYVDRQGTPNPSRTVGVNVGQVASVAFDYDRAAALDVTLAGATGGTAADATSVSLGNTGLLPSGYQVVTGTGATRTITDLYPYPDGFDSWAGSCADADPEGKDAGSVAYWPGAARPDPVAVDPAAASSVTIPMATVEITWQAAVPTGTDTVIAVHAPDSRCAAGETLTVATFSTTSGTALVALPYGTWTLKATGRTPVGSWPIVTLDPRSTATVSATVQV